MYSVPKNVVHLEKNAISQELIQRHYINKLSQCHYIPFGYSFNLPFIIFTELLPLIQKDNFIIFHFSRFLATALSK